MYSDSAQRQVRQLATDMFRDRHDYLLAIARRNAHTEADAEEALQEAFAAFIVHFDPGRGSPPLAWLTLTLKRQCWRQRGVARLDLQAPRRQDGEDVLEALSSSAPETAERVAEREDARGRLTELKPDERDALGLFAAGLSYAEIGQRRGWTYTKVNRCISEGRAALRGSQLSGGAERHAGS